MIDTPPSTLAFDIRRELLALALRNAHRSVLLLLAAGWFVAWLGWANGLPRISAVAAALTALVSAWRWFIGRGELVEHVCEARVDRLEIQLAGNALLAGVLWAVATLAIYPWLDNRSGSALLVILVGSAAVAAQFMTLVRWSYMLLVMPSIGSLALVSIANDTVRSPPLAVLAVIYALTLLLTGREYRETAIRAIRHGLEVDRTNLQLQRAKEAAEAAALARSQFLATMSHEIRTPMNGVLGSLELLRRLGLNDEQRRLVRTAAASGESLMAILNDVLDHSKIEAGKLVLMPVPVSLHRVATAVATLFRANADAKGLVLDLEIDERAPDWVVADGQRLKQVLANLISNAIKFTDHGGVTLRLLAAAPTAHGVGAHFEVIDSGIGITPEGVQTLFSPFTQVAHNSTKTRRGTGLGLAISQRIVEAMGGQIEVESQLGEGSCFRFALALSAHEGEHPPAPPETSAGMLDALGPIHGTVLVAEDDEVNRMIARAMLESLGLTVIEANDGLEALAVGIQLPPDLVFMDCQMPNLDGYGAAQRWRRREAEQGLRRTPIIAMTANAFDEDAARARAAGMDGHLAKPYTRVQLRDTVAQWL